MARTKKIGKSDVDNPGKTSPIVVEKYLGGISFPANKETLIQVAQNNNAPDMVMQILNKIADEEYSSVIEIAREVSEAKNI